MVSGRRAHLRRGVRELELTTKAPRPPSTASWDGWELLVTVPGQPQPWQRAGTHGTHRFTPAATANAEHEIGMVARFALGARLPLSCPVELHCWFYRANLVRCDLDNLEKLVKDALNGVAWLDDSQVTDAAKIKRVDRANPRTVIRVRPAPADAAANWA